MNDECAHDEDDLERLGTSSARAEWHLPDAAQASAAGAQGMRLRVHIDVPESFVRAVMERQPDMLEAILGDHAGTAARRLLAKP